MNLGSEGNLKEKLFLNRAGTPSEEDYIISFDVTLKAGMGQERPGPMAAHRACDKFLQLFREQLEVKRLSFVQNGMNIMMLHARGRKKL